MACNADADAGGPQGEGIHGQVEMSLFDSADAEDFRPNRTLLQTGGDYLEFDELLARGGNDLAIESDGEDCLVLVEGADFE